MGLSPPLPSAGREGHLLVTRSLAPGVVAAAEARNVVREVLTRTDHLDLVEVACLLTSELVANAVVHGAAPVDLVVDLDDSRLAVEVIDSSDHDPLPGPAAADDEHGRGLSIVATLADAWGVAPGSEGKAVWFALATG